MKLHRSLLALSLGLGICQFGMAQAPAGSTGVCKDGSYTSAPKKTGACRGHKGVQQWFATNTSTTTASASKLKPAVATPAPAAAPASAPAPTVAPTHAAKASSATSSNVAAAPGGGPGLVWVNTATNVYHCSGSRFYGKTKEGKYMTEAQAKSAGAHANHGKGCGQ